MAQTSRLVIELDSRDAEAKAADTRKALEALEDAGLSIQPALNKAGAGMEKMGKGADKASKSIEDEREEIEQLLGSIDPLTRKMNELEKQELALAKARKSGKIDLDTYNDYQAKLTTTRSALTGFNSDLNKTGMSAKATAAALRGVPAQFTDIAVSLQGGQAPLTVFLQQGGQLKDMFGGAAPAAKALGTYVLGLVNPFTVAAAAIGVLGVAYYQGSQEQDAYRLSLVTTGNAAGTTTLALAEMAKQVSGTVGTTADAAAALAQLAATGKIASSNFEQIATSAISYEKATGKAVSETIAEFVRLADDPVKAVAELNNKYNFLTASVYEQVRAAQEMGEKEAAAAIAQEAYAKALGVRAETMKSSLGTLEKAWNDLAGAAKTGWDAILGIGRESNSGPDVKAIQQKINYLKSTLDTAYEDGDARERIASLQAELDAYDKKSKAEQKAADDAARAAQIQRDGQAAYDGFQKSIEDKFSKTQKMNKALSDEEKRIAAARLAGYTITAEQEAAAYKAIRENSAYKESAAKKEKAYTEDAGTKMLDQARKQYAVLQQQGLLIDNQANGTKALGTEAKKLIALEQQIADIKGKQTLTADQKSILAMADLNIAQQKRNAELEKEVELKKKSAEETRKLAAFQENLNSQLDLAREGLSNQLAGFGMGDKARQRLQEDLRIQQSYQKQMNELTKSFNESDRGEFSQDRYDKETAMIQAALAERLAYQKGYYRDIDALQSDWRLGASAAWQDYADEASDIAGQTYDLFSNSLHGIEDAFVDAATSCKLSFKDLADSVIADLARIAAKTLLIKPLISALFGSEAAGGPNNVGGLVGSLFGSSGGSEDSSFGGLVSLGKNLYSAWNAVTGVGSSIASGYASGGIGGAVSGGVGYYANMLSSLTSTLSSGFSGLTGAIFGSSASQIAANAATSAALQGAVAEGAASVGTSIGVGGLAAEGAGAAVGAAAAGAGSGFYASLAAMASNPVGWVIAAVTSAYQSGKLYDKGIRPDAGEMWDSGGGTVLGKSTMLPAAATAKYFEVADKLLSKVVGGKMAAMLTGSTLFQAVWSKVGSKLFGSGYETKDAGVQLGVSGGMLEAYQYQDQKKKGGLISGSSKKRTLLSPLDEARQKEVQNAFDARLDTVFGIFDTLNVDVPESALDGLNMDAWKISLKDLTADQVNQLFSDFFEVLGNEAVGAISKSMGLGLDTYNVNQLTEFVSNLYSINDTFKLLNVNALPVSVWGGKLAEQYVALAGGMEAFNTATQGYYNSPFFTDAERNANTLEAVKKQFADLNIAFPASREGFRALVEGIDSTTDAGRQMFITLMGLAGNASTAFDILQQQADAAAAAAQSVFDALMGSVSNAQSGVQRAISAQQKALTDAYNKQIDSLNTMLSTATENVSDLTSVGNDLSSALKSLRGDSDDAIKMLRAQAQATLKSALATARAGGSLAGIAGLSDALDTVGNNNTDLYGSMEDFARDQGRTAIVVAELNAINGKQLTSAEQTVETLKRQLKLAEEQYKSQSEKLDQQLAFAQAQVDALNGVDNSILGVTAAVNAMNAAVVAALAGMAGKGAGNSATTNGTFIDSVYKDVLGRDADAAGKNYWLGELANGHITLDQLAQAIANAAKEKGQSVKAGYATGGYISGPGSGTSDSIVARLSNGEYVLTADAVRKYGIGLLDQMNAGQLPAFASGGGIRLVSSSGPADVSGSRYSGASKSSGSALSSGSQQGVIDAINALQNYLYMITKYSEQTASGVRRQNEMQEAA